MWPNEMDFLAGDKTNLFTKSCFESLLQDDGEYATVAVKAAGKKIKKLANKNKKAKVNKGKYFYSI